MTVNISTLKTGAIINLWNQMLEKASTKFNDPQSTQALRSIIDYARNVFDQSLEKNFKELDLKFQNFFYQIHQEITTLENMGQSLKETADKMQLVANTLVKINPFASTCPQISKVSPTFVQRSKFNLFSDDKILISVLGNFPDITSTNSLFSDVTPILKIKGIPFKPSSSTSMRLEYLIPKHYFSRITYYEQKSDGKIEDLTDRTPITFLEGTLTFYKCGWFWKTPYKPYRVLITIIPPSPGDLKIKIISSEILKKTKEISSQIYHQSSSPDGSNCDITHNYSLQSTNGWFLDTNTSRVDLISSSGHFQIDRIVNTKSEVVFKVFTKYHPVFNAGIVNFQIKAIEEKEETKEKETEEAIDLKWGNSKAINIPTNAKFVVTLDSFDGQHNEYTSPDTNRFLKIFLNSRGQLSIEAKPIDQISGPLSSGAATPLRSASSVSLLNIGDTLTVSELTPLGSFFANRLTQRVLGIIVLGIIAEFIKKRK